MNKRQGKIVIFTGDGKGKTTSALGLAIKTAVQERRVVIVQFLKGGGYTGELFAASCLEPYLVIKQFGYGCHISEQIKSGKMVCTKCGKCFRENRNISNQFAPQALNFAAKSLSDGNLAMLIMDEVSHAIRHGLIDKQAVVDLIMSRPDTSDIILTGRNMPDELIEMANQVTICHAVKHPIKKGIDARRGTEY